MRIHHKAILAAGVLSAVGLAVWIAGPAPADAGVPQSTSASFQPECPAEPQRSGESLRRWADTVDIAAIREQLEQTGTFTDEQRRSEVSRALLDSWARRDPRALGAWFGSRNVADVLHQEARDALALQLSQGDAEETLSWMAASLSHTVRQEILGPYFRELSKRDPNVAGAKLRELSQTAKSDAVLWNDVVGQVASQWAAADLEPALAWAGSLPEGPAKSAALLQMSPRWVRDDPVAAAAYAAGRDEPALLQNVAVLWAERDLHGAMAWATTLSAGEGRTATISRLVGIWAQRSPENAVAYISGIPVGDTRDRATIEAVSSWASTQPEQAADWVLQIPEGRLREEALGELLNAWAGPGSEAAGRWLQQLPPAPSRDVAVDTFCRLIDSTEPGSAFRWATTITDETTRNRRLSEAALFWLETDKKAALVAITLCSLPASLKQQLLSDIQ